MAAFQRKLVHKQFNSPIGLYSQDNVKETLKRELKAFGSDGIEIDEQIARPLNLANSEVLRAVEEEEQMKCGYKRVAWPPASEERVVREFTPQPGPAYNQQYQPSAAGASNSAVPPPTQNPVYNNVQHSINNFVRETKPPLEQYSHQNYYEAFPPQTPETPIILKDKQFSRLPSQEPNQPNTLPYQQQYQQPQNQTMQQQHYKQEQPELKQPSHDQNAYEQQQQQYQANQQSVSLDQQHQQQYKTQEEHREHHLPGWKPIRPPHTKQDLLFTGHNGVSETMPSIAPHNFQQLYQNYHQPTANQQQQYRAPSYDSYQQPKYQQTLQQQQQQYPPQPQYQAQLPQAPQNLYQQPSPAGPYYQQALQQQPAWAQQQSVQPQQPQQQYQQPPWVQQPQQQQQQQHYQPPQQYQNQNQNPLNQYSQAPHHQQQPQQQQEYTLQQNQFIPQTNQQQFNSYSQPQQQQHTVSHDQVDQQSHLPLDQRGTSPGIITLRKEAPITQKPAPVYTSQPAAISFRESSTDSLGGSNMRGDLKWPPPEYKEAAAKENEERRQLALGPVCRPRKVHRDYTSFFAKNALSHHYPSYKVPPGTQHMIN